MRLFRKFEPYIGSICQTVHDLTDQKGLSINTLVTLYRYFTTQQVPFDDSAIQCAPGCGYCCHLKVTGSIPEIVVIADYLRKNNLVDYYRQQVSMSSARIIDRRGKDDVWWVENAIPCIFLDSEKHTCNIYEVRPFSCRGYHSLDVNQCRKGYDNRTITQIPCYADLKRSREIFSISFERAMVEMNLQSHQVELSSAVVFFLQQPDLQEKWLAGEQILTSVPPE